MRIGNVAKNVSTIKTNDLESRVLETNIESYKVSAADVSKPSVSAPLAPISTIKYLYNFNCVKNQMQINGNLNYKKDIKTTIIVSIIYTIITKISNTRTCRR